MVLKTIPFPLPIQLGTDICQISRIFSIITSSSPKVRPKFIDRVLTLEEQLANRERLQLPTLQETDTFRDAETDIGQNGKGKQYPWETSFEQLKAKHPKEWKVAEFLAGRQVKIPIIQPWQAIKHNITTSRSEVAYIKVTDSQQKRQSSKHIQVILPHSQTSSSNRTSPSRQTDLEHVVP